MKGTRMQKFNEMVTKGLAHYVYALADPRSEGSLAACVFYIGKGQGNRCFHHAREEREKGEEPLKEEQHKLGTLRDIRESGHEVEVMIVAHGLSKTQALRLEATLIPFLGVTNKAAGHGDGGLWLSSTQIEELHDNPISRHDAPELAGNILIVSLNQQDIDALAQDEKAMAKATLGEWNIGEERSRKVDLLIGVKRGLIVSIFETHKDAVGVTKFKREAAKEKGKHRRSIFCGTRARDLEQKLKGRSLQDGKKVLSKVRPGAACQFLFALASESPE